MKKWKLITENGKLITKNGKLITENERVNDVNGSYLINIYACPSCNWKVRTEGEMEYRFCPMCGEDLRGK